MVKLTTKQKYHAIDAWNTKNSVGSSVSYRKDDGTTLQTKTRSDASMLSGHTPVIWLDGIAGCVDLTRVRPA